MTVGELAAHGGVSADTIRYYERLGLLPPAPRAANGYRQYPESASRRILLIRNAVQFGFSLKELRDFLSARDAATPPCQAVRQAAQLLLNDLDQQLAELTATRTSLKRTLKEWDARLASRAAGAPAHLLESLPARKGHSLKRRRAPKRFKP